MRRFIEAELYKSYRLGEWIHFTSNKYFKIGYIVGNQIQYFRIKYNIENWKSKETCMIDKVGQCIRFRGKNPREELFFSYNKEKEHSFYVCVTNPETESDGEVFKLDITSVIYVDSFFANFSKIQEIYRKYLEEKKYSSCKEIRVKYLTNAQKYTNLTSELVMKFVNEKKCLNCQEEPPKGKEKFVNAILDIITKPSVISKEHSVS